MMYKIILDKKATKTYDTLPKYVIEGFKEKFKKLAENPYTITGVDTIKNPKSIGFDVDIAYRIRVADYRAIYTICDDIVTIIVLDIDHRSVAYRKRK